MRVELTYWIIGPEAAVVRALEKNEIPVKEGETVFKKVRWGEQPPV